MNRTQVNSTDIASIGYDSNMHQLEVEFKRGSRLYVYADVPQHVYQGLISAPSKGQYLATNIKGRYAFSTKEK